MQTSLKAFGVLLAFVLALACGQSEAQGYPSKTIRFVVGFPPGGGVDFIARMFGEKLAERLGQPIVVDNKPGADSIIGTEYVAKSAPDGYTLLIGGASMSFNPALYNRLPYDTLKDFTPITPLATYALLIVVNPSVAATSLKELIALAKAKPGSLFYAAGAPPFRMATELFKRQAGVDIVHVPYKGTAAAITAVVAGEVAMAAVDMAPALPQLKAGKLRSLAVTSPKRSAIMPDIPTMSESGVDFDMVGAMGLFAPAGTPRAIIDKLYGELSVILRSDSVKKRLASLSYEPGGITPEAFGAKMKADVEKWITVAKEARIRVE